MFRVVVSVLLVIVGGLAVVGGELDDSPGLGGIGLLIIAGVVVYWVRQTRRRDGRNAADSAA